MALTGYDGTCRTVQIPDSVCGPLDFVRSLRWLGEGAPQPPYPLEICAFFFKSLHALARVRTASAWHAKTDSQVRCSEEIQATTLVCMPTPEASSNLPKLLERQRARPIVGSAPILRDLSWLTNQNFEVDVGGFRKSLL